jgi:acyl-CoA reductase-like NAD-dependent aldehyde dehydrogenase
VGIVLDIAAWNYPLLIAVNVVVPAVIAGDAVILKHSSRTPLCAGHFADAFARAGAPAGAVVPLVADHATTAALAARSEVAYVAFTGSVDGGFEISRAASGRAIDVGLELGGKDPAYVRADADIASVASALVEGAFYNAGQSCCAIERVYVDRAAYAPFLEAAVAAASSWRCGPPGDPATLLGPMAQPRGLATVQDHVGEAVAKGARLLTGGKTATVDGRGRYYEATVLADADHSMRVMTEETFGPVLPVVAVAGDEDALRAMNDSRYGLTASIWTRDVDCARRLGQRIEAGTVFLNRCDYLEPSLPWSGWKDSGVGITLSRLGFDRLVRTRGFHMRLPS